MIQGYPDQPSVLPGGTLTLHVSTDASQFRVDFYRQGQTLELKQRSGWLLGQNLPPHLPYQDWGHDGTGIHGELIPAWPAYDFPIPGDWTSGVYIAMFVQGDGQGNVVNPPDFTTADGRDAKALFVVKSPNPGVNATILYKIPLLTYQAYNQVSSLDYRDAPHQGFWSLYTVPDLSNHPEQYPELQDLPKPLPQYVTIHRPGGGTGGTPWDWWNFDPFDSTMRQTFVHWDAPFIAWLERNNYQVEYCTDLDLDQDSNLDLLAAYTLLLSVGHDEYWTTSMRDHLEVGFIPRGRNVAFFSGDICWWQTIFDDTTTFHRTANWYDPNGPNRPENSLTGVSSRNGSERNQKNFADEQGNYVAIGYQVQHADHWVFEGTGLQEREVFGGGQQQYIVGYECDGALFDRNALNQGTPVSPTSTDGTPQNFLILGIGDVKGVRGWGDIASPSNQAATMGIYTQKGTVFTAATTDWTRVLASGQDPQVEQITRNVLDALSSPVFGTWQITANGSQGHLMVQWAHASASGGLQVRGTVTFTDQPGTTDTITGTWDAVAKAITFVRGPDNPVSQTFTGFLGDNHADQQLILAGWFTESDIPANAPRTKFGWFAEKSR